MKISTSLEHAVKIDKVSREPAFEFFLHHGKILLF